MSLLLSKTPLMQRNFSIERDGAYTIIKCRTPGEAFLVAQELEEANILVVLPDEALFEDEYRNTGHVQIRVLTAPFEAAEEAKKAIAAPRWEDRSKEPLSTGMFLTGMLMGLLPFFTVFPLFIMRGAYINKGHTAKWKSLKAAYLIGTIAFVVSCNAYVIKNS